MSDSGNREEAWKSGTLPAAIARVEPQPWLTWRQVDLIDGAIVPLNSSDNLGDPWHPPLNREWADAFSELWRADSEGLLDWARRWGQFGLPVVNVEHSHPFGGNKAGEAVDAIHDRLTDLAIGREILRLLRLPNPDLDKLRRFREGLVEEEYDPSWGPELALQAGIRVLRPDSLRKGAGVELQALDAIAEAAGSVLIHTARFHPRVVGDHTSMSISATVSVDGPLGVAWAQTYLEASSLTISHQTGSRRLDWRQPRSCGRCHKPFVPRTQRSAWCSERCRWAASKAGIPNPYADD